MCLDNNYYDGKILVVKLLLNCQAVTSCIRPNNSLTKQSVLILDFAF